MLRRNDPASWFRASLREEGRDDVLIRIGQSADHGFDEPLGLLSDCHRRIERFLGVLLTVAGERSGAELAQADREALSVALHYFRAAAPKHTADEEQSLFPRLRGAGGHARAALEALDRLEADHRAADEHHAAVDALGHRWLAQGTLAADDAAALREHLHALRTIYEAHIALEDSQLFPAAAAVLAPADIEAIGREMAERRGVALDRVKASVS